MSSIFSICCGSTKIMEQKALFTFRVEVEPQIHNYGFEPTEERPLKVRLDKWLWAARFFKTRALARAAIENGYVQYGEQKVVPSKEIELGVKLVIQQGKVQKAVIIRGLSTRRRKADDAKCLFEEIKTEIVHMHNN